MQPIPEVPIHTAGRISAERQKIGDSGVLQALLDYTLGKREMAPSQVSAGFAVLKKVLPDLSPAALSDELDDTCVGNAPGPSSPKIQFRIVDPANPGRFETLQV